MLYLSSNKGIVKPLEIRGIKYGRINKIVYCLDTLQVKGLIKPPNKLVAVSKCKNEIISRCESLKIQVLELTQRVQKYKNIGIKVSSNSKKMNTREELIKICKERGIKGYSKRKKEELIQLISTAPDTRSNRSERAVPKGSIEDAVPFKAPETSNNINNEDLGKEFEKAVCIYYGIEFKGNFKYSIENAKRLADKLTPLKELWAPSAEHTANNRSSHDFTYLCNGLSRHLSLKTNKTSGGKICPQVIGQPTSKTFRKHFGLSEDVNIKDYITNNFPSMLKKYWNNAYDVPMLYYNEKDDKIYYIKPSSYPEFEKEYLSLGKVGKDWNESTTLKYKGETIGEFQVHNHRDCIKFRWNHKNLMDFMDIIEF